MTTKTSEIKEVKLEAKKAIKSIVIEKSQIEQENTKLHTINDELRNMLVSAYETKGKANAQLILAVIALVINVGCWVIYYITHFGVFK